MLRKLLPLCLKQRRRGLAAAALFFLIFLVSFALYRLPLAAVLYPAALCAIAGAVFLTADLRRAARKHEQLQAIRSAVDVASRPLPQVESPEDEAYQQILQLLADEQRSLQTAMDRRYAEMIDYYTLWAHQIKTPIASMGLRLQNEDSALSRALSSDLFRIEQYVGMALVYLRLNSESSDYLIREYELDGIIRQAVKKFAGEFISRKLRLVYEPVQTRVLTDEKWLSFVIEQILSNALKYTPSGSISISLEAPKTLCIRDTGIGIAPEDLPRIFEKGYTGCNGRRDKRASGIGLYLCKRICRNLGHGISASSSVGQGSAIRIDLNRAELRHE